MVISTDNILRLVDFIIGTVETEGKIDNAKFSFSGGVVNKEKGKIVLSVDLGRGISLNIEFPPSEA